MNLNWTASTDNVGVSGYRVERCQGAGCTNFAQVGTPTATAYSDTGLAPSTTYRYQVRAVDAVRQPRRVLHPGRGHHPVAPPTPPGLVGAWAFNEGSGTTTADASGRGNHGNLDRRHLDDPGPLRQRPELQRLEQRGPGRRTRPRSI